MHSKRPATVVLTCFNKTVMLKISWRFSWQMEFVVVFLVVVLSQQRAMLEMKRSFFNCGCSIFQAMFKILGKPFAVSVKIQARIYSGMT